MSQAKAGFRKTIGSLAPTMQGIALDLKLGEEVAITTDEHFSEGHGRHFDIYAMKRVSESEVYLFKWHSNEETGNSTMDQHRRELESKVIYSPLSKSDKSCYPLDEHDFEGHHVAGC